MDRETYRTILSNWADRAEECERIASDIARRDSILSFEYRRARALEAGYRAAIEAAHGRMQPPKPIR